MAFAHRGGGRILLILILCLFLFLFIIMSTCCTTASRIISPASSSQDFTAVPFFFSPQIYNFTTTSIDTGTWSGCDAERSGFRKFANKTLMTNQPPGCEPRELYKSMQRVGVILWILDGQQQTAGRFQLGWYEGAGSNDLLGQLLFVDVSKAIGALFNQRNLTVNFVPDVNPWINMYTSLGFFFVVAIVAGFSSICVILAIHKFSRFYKLQNGFRLTLPQVTLFLGVVENLIRLAVVIDPFGYRQVFPRRLWLTLASLSIAFSLTTSLLLLVYWRELVDPNTIKTSLFVNNKGAMLVFVVTVVMVVVDIGFSMLVANFSNLAGLGSILNGLHGVFYAVANIVVAVFFIKARWKLIQYQKTLSPSRMDDRNTRIISKASVYLFISGICMISFSLSAVLIATPMYQTPLGYNVSWLLISGFISIVSLTQILIFNPKVHTRPKPEIPLDNIELKF